MRKAFITLTCLAALLVASPGLKAQEVTITLNPGWTWISCPIADTLDFATAFGSFNPCSGDIIRSRWGSACYRNGQWRGSFSKFYPGYGYRYYSSRTESAVISFPIQQPVYQEDVVTTLGLTGVTATSVVVSGDVTIDAYNHVYAHGMCWGTYHMPTVDDDHTSDGIGTGVFTDTLIGLLSSTTYYVRAYAVTDFGLVYGEELNFTTAGHTYVDLGLPSGTLWATYNVGAEAPEEYGNYFAWGETQPKDNCIWSTYMYCHGSSNTLTKYCNKSNYGYNGFTDGLTTLQPQDDAATVNWGPNWRMPTKEEWQELYQNTTNTWTTLNGVSGRLFTASNGNTLFLPAAGYLGGSNFYFIGSYGYYGSKSLDTANNPSHMIGFRFMNSTGSGLNPSNRCYGLSVRPVRTVQQH